MTTGSQSNRPSRGHPPAFLLGLCAIGLCWLVSTPLLAADTNTVATPAQVANKNATATPTQAGNTNTAATPAPGADTNAPAKPAEPETKKPLTPEQMFEGGDK